MVPGRKIVWTVLDNPFSCTRDATEWTGTDIVFERTKSGDRTELRFTHLGLVPAYECYDVSSAGWRTYIARLRDLVANSEGRPYAGDARPERKSGVKGRSGTVLVQREGGARIKKKTTK